MLSKIEIKFRSTDNLTLRGNWIEKIHGAIFKSSNKVLRLCRKYDYANGIIEGINNKIKVLKHIAFLI